jgi:hypothetical protein
MADLILELESLLQDRIEVLGKERPEMTPEEKENNSSSLAHQAEVDEYDEKLIG